jgi:beta-xylosidase
VDVIGVSCYSSRDLIHWKNEGVVLPSVPGDIGHDLHPSKVAERPKVIFNPKTGKYVMWLHIDSADYTAARAGVAISDKPTGPYTYLGSIRPNGRDSRDMTLFQDDDGKAYLIHSSDWNSVTIISDLNDDYLSFTGHYTRHFDHGSKNTGRESPALFKHNGKYFIITSGTTGWNPNPAEYAVADSVHGPWTVKGNPCEGVAREVTFQSQNTFVLPVQGKPGAFIFMADRWNKHDLRDSRYVWLPLHVRGEEIALQWAECWDLSIFSNL